MLTSVSEFKEVTVATAVFNYHIALLKGAGDESVVRVVRVVVLIVSILVLAGSELSAGAVSLHTLV